MFRHLFFALLGMLLLPAPSICQDIGKILASDYEYKMISSGRNYPTVDIQANHLGEICILLHHRVPVEEINRYFHWSDQELQSRLDILLKENLIKRDDRFGYLPSFMLISLEDGKRLAKPGGDLEKQVTRLIVTKLPEIRKRYDEIEGLRGMPFQKTSLLILSNVLPDNWQIRNVEQRFLRAERPLRNGMHYYYSIQEKVKGAPTEAFGIYGNMNSGYGSASVSLYGNQRQGLNFITIEKPQLKEWFGIDDSEDAWKFKQKLVEEVLRLSSNANAALSEQHKQGFEKLGFIENGKLSVPIFHKGDQKKLAEIAGLITDELIRLLEKHRSELEKSYRESAYSQEVSFEEYGIWWYHFFYTDVTENLIAKGYITRPATGVFTYLNSQ